MRVFISGATGVLGRRVVRGLNEGSHAVIGLSRSQANSEWLRQNGAEPRSGDLFDPAQMIDLTADCDAVLHLATAIPTKSRTTTADWQMNDRIRRRGTRALVEAALGNECKLYIQQSLTLIYGEQDGNWVDENSAIPERQPAILDSALDMEHIVQDAIKQHDLPAIILRCGSFYSADSAQTQAILQLVKRGFFPIAGDGRTYWNPVHVDDAASAVVKAVENYEAGLGEIFNVCDDEPVYYGEMMDYIAETLGARRPVRVPQFLNRLMLGAHVVEAIFASARCRNEKLKEKMDWMPRFKTYRAGYRSVIEEYL